MCAESCQHLLIPLQPHLPRVEHWYHPSRTSRVVGSRWCPVASLLADRYVLEESQVTRRLTFCPLGSVIGLSVQAGLYSRVDNDLSNWKGTQYGYGFDIAWLGVSLLAFIIFYHPEASRKVLSELEEKEKTHGERIETADVSVA